METTSHCVVLGGIGGLSKSRGFAFGASGLIVLRVKIAVSGASLVATEYGACACSSWRLLARNKGLHGGAEDR